MNRLSYLIILVAAILTLPGCTQNDGDIGPWFGTWRLEQILVDGADDEAYNHDIIWKFQSDVISMVVVDDATHTAASTWGTWSEADNTLTLNFSYSDTANPAGSFKYSPPAATHLPPGISRLSIISLSKGEITLGYIDQQGVTYTYKLAKHG